MPDSFVYRITRAPYADLTGEGARLARGRWTRARRAAVYTFESRSLADLHHGWQEIGADAAFDRGGAWLREAAAVSRVPSVLLPEEYNVVLNLLHPEHAQIRVVDVRSCRLDPRLLAPRNPHR